MSDLRFALRALGRAPGFTLAAALTLALGIGANTAVFSIVNVFVLKPLPFHESDRLMFVLGWDTARDRMRFNLPLADFIDLQTRSRAFAGLAAYRYWSANLTGGDQPERVQAYRVTAGTFPVLGVEPLIGRPITAADERDGARVAVLSHGLWTRSFAASPDVVGRTVVLDGETHTVVGVMPRDFEFPVFNFKGDVWTLLPLGPSAAERAESVVTVGRLAPEASVAAAQDDVSRTMRSTRDERSQANRDLGARVIPMRELGAEVGQPVAIVISAVVGLVLLLACGNVANLLLGRGAARQRELTVRSALGASRRVLVRQLLIESFVLAGIGAALGVALAYWGLAAFSAWLPEMIVRTMPNLHTLGVDAAALAFTLLLAVASTLIFGLVPALRLSRPDLAESLKGTARLAGATGHTRLRSALIAAETALALLILVTAGLFIQTIDRLTQVDPGFDASGVMTMSLSLAEQRYPQPEDREAFFTRTLERVAALPGVSSAAFVNALPFSTYDNRSTYLVEGQVRPDGQPAPSARWRAASPAYFETLRIPVLRGRGFTAIDGRDAPPVAVINEALARREFASADPLGRRIRTGGDESSNPWRTVIGVVGDVRHATLTEAFEPELYVPLAQSGPSEMMLAVRGPGEASALVGAVRAAVLALDPQQPIFHVKPMEQLIADSTLAQASIVQFVTLFAALALALAGVGVFGVISYAVSQQVREYGIRLAVGAAPSDVVRLVLRRGLSPVALGIAIGLAAAAGVTQLMRGLLYGVSPLDATSYGVAVATLLAVALLACFGPAARAMRVDPVDALRAE